MAGEVDCECGDAEPEYHGVPGVRVLAATVEENHPGPLCAPPQCTDRAAFHPGYCRKGPVDAGLCGVLTQQGELAEGEQFVVGDHRSI